MLESLLLFAHVVVCLGLILLVLLQRGKGSEMGGGMGGGVSQTVFGSQGSHDFLGQMTKYFGVSFFVICLTLSYLANQQLRHERGMMAPVPSGTSQERSATVLPDALPD